ncbi:MAG: GYD domain-containing protein [Candidatus Eremiobacteraeota bacterium]|nr:GYD domain-containing protein [Candidatus Eremiobacteraeota bacterium]MBC5827824.1 GYD domain-containing protein [Candidatus Eremiobacteraeota bacterium]
MAKFLIEASYTLDGSKGVLSGGGSARRTALREMVESAGGKIEALYFAFGKHDIVIIVDMPDNVSAAAIAVQVKAAGSALIRTTVLMTPEELDQAAKKGVKYRPPGK